MRASPAAENRNLSGVTNRQKVIPPYPPTPSTLKPYISAANGRIETLTAANVLSRRGLSDGALVYFPDESVTPWRRRRRCRAQPARAARSIAACEISAACIFRSNLRCWATLSRLSFAMSIKTGFLARFEEKMSAATVSSSARLPHRPLRLARDPSLRAPSFAAAAVPPVGIPPAVLSAAGACVGAAASADCDAAGSGECAVRRSSSGSGQ